MNVYVSPQWWWRLLIVAAGVTGLYGAGYNIVAYTTQSTIIVIGYYSGVLFWMHRRRTVDAAAPRLRAAVLSWILLSGVVLHFVLAGGRSPLPGLTSTAGTPVVLANWSSFLLHYALPGMVLLDWLLTRPYGAVRWRDLLLWTLYPLGYAAVLLARGALFPDAGYRYPYAFLDPTFQGWTAAGTWIALLTAGFLLLGAVLVAIDQLRRPHAPSPTTWPEATAPAPSWPEAAGPTPTWPDAAPSYGSGYRPAADPRTAVAAPSWPTAADPRTAEAAPSWPTAADPRTADAVPSWPTAAGPEPYSATPPAATGPRAPNHEPTTAAAPSWPTATGQSPQARPRTAMIPPSWGETGDPYNAAPPHPDGPRPSATGPWNAPTPSPWSTPPGSYGQDQDQESAWPSPRRRT
ncbi:Pr6Pr family membrane protein [Actinoplanes sp. NBC_00393]|uniref:Pr6Pr family membrane protein n=1 Tax=Actinoplanes sp. NBC_00393 TaxID=2975953 RepID=UPI002E1C93AF